MLINDKDTYEKSIGVLFSLFDLTENGEILMENEDLREKILQILQHFKIYNNLNSYYY